MQKASKLSRLSRGALSVVSVAVAAGLSGSASAAVFDYSVTSTLYQQTTNYFCGPATAQMILSSAGIAAGSIPTQQTLFNTITGAGGNPGNYNGGPGGLSNVNKWSTNGNYATNPTGLRNAVQAVDGAHSYVAYNISNVNVANRLLAFDISNYQVGAGALVGAMNAGGGIKGGSHWVAVVGLNTNVKPTAGGNYTVNGFYVRDPWSGTTFATNSGVPGFGFNAYLATTGADAKWAQYFVPTAFGGTWQGNYSFVADPDPGEDGTDPVFPGTPASNSTNGAQAITDASNAVAADPGLSGDTDFQSGGFNSSGETLIPAGAALSDPEWLVPYDGAGGETGVALIDANTGVLDAAYWDEGAVLPSGFDAEVIAQDAPAGLAPTDNIQSIPEPASALLIGFGGVALLRRRGARKA